MPEKKKMGRPTDSPKIHEVKTRVDEKTMKILENYCVKNKKKRAEGLRDGILRLKDPE